MRHLNNGPTSFAFTNPNVAWSFGNAPISTYRISLGTAADAGPKQREGEEKTPEGRYEIDWRNPKSMDYLSLHISYPNTDDRRNAEAGGFPAGGDIMIH